MLHGWADLEKQEEGSRRLHARGTVKEQHVSSRIQRAALTKRPVTLKGQLGDYFHHIIAWGNPVVVRLCLCRQIAVYLMIHVFFTSCMILPA